MISVHPCVCVCVCVSAAAGSGQEDLQGSEVSTLSSQQGEPATVSDPGKNHFHFSELKELKSNFKQVETHLCTDLDGSHLGLYR